MKRIRAVAWDSWAFLEVLSAGPRETDVADLLRATEYVFTVREVVAETFNFIVRRTGQTAKARTWWNALRASRVRVFEPPLDEVHAFVESRGGEGSLSLTDYALAFVAQREGATQVAAEDREFRRLRLDPLFAKR